ncbi:methyltransferase domain-containing protein [Streptosporangium sp. NPDC006007]|uniref:methyltransferase domain-containing protein n=1 Tax=Streptosporangium sp. NPDC006007 TaxID=3154575 RepID=UPI0033AA1CEE
MGLFLQAVVVGGEITPAVETAAELVATVVEAALEVVATAVGTVLGPLQRPCRWLRGVAVRLLFERRYGVRTSDTVSLARLGLAGEERVDYVAASWRLLRRTLPRRAVGESDVFIDLGSGMGRMVLEAAWRYPFKKVIGVELSGELNDIARQNIVGTRLRLRCENVELVQSDVLDYEIPEDVSVVFLNNPFRGETFATVITRLLATVDRNPRPVTVIYLNPTEEDLLLSTGRFHHVRTLKAKRKARPDSPFDWIRIYTVSERAGA